MMRINDHLQCLYHKDHGPRLFHPGEKITEGWHDSPDFEDPRTQKMWIDGEVPQPETRPEIDPWSSQKADPRKYPSQMNKAELMEHGKLLGIELDESLTVREMRQSINESLQNEA